MYRRDLSPSQRPPARRAGAGVGLSDLLHPTNDFNPGSAPELHERAGDAPMGRSEPERSPRYGQPRSSLDARSGASGFLPAAATHSSRSPAGASGLAFSLTSSSRSGSSLARRESLSNLRGDSGPRLSPIGGGAAGSYPGAAYGGSTSSYSLSSGVEGARGDPSGPSRGYNPGGAEALYRMPSQPLQDPRQLRGGVASMMDLRQEPGEMHLWSDASSGTLSGARERGGVSTSTSGPNATLVYECWFCSAVFNRESALRSHHVVHTGDKFYLCLYCPKAFTTQSNVNRHEKKIHAEDIERWAVVAERNAEILRRQAAADPSRPLPLLPPELRQPPLPPRPVPAQPSANASGGSPATSSGAGKGYRRR